MLKEICISPLFTFASVIHLLISKKDNYGLQDNYIENKSSKTWHVGFLSGFLSWLS